VKEYNTVYVGLAQKIDELKRNAPIGEMLVLKEGALVMFRQNDPELKYVNGTLGTITKLKDNEVRVELLNGRTIDLKPSSFNVLDAEGEVVATATNFPLNLAWACTIHKAQGATLDKAHVDLRGVWEHGQSYVALSRVRSLEDLTLEGYSPNGFKLDPAVREFYRRMT
jgi:ATP-dependent exoDNAse (exonuclease V) alpha subunit